MEGNLALTKTCFEEVRSRAQSNSRLLPTNFILNDFPVYSFHISSVYFDCYWVQLHHCKHAFLYGCSEILTPNCLNEPRGYFV